MSRKKTEAAPAPAAPGFLRAERLPLLLAALAAFLAFLPALGADFVTWDDDWNFLNNQSFRGLGPKQLYWMFTTFLGGPYQPLTWLTFGLDYTLWGMNPFNYHLTNLLLHSAGAALFYALSLRLLRAALPGRDAGALRLGAFFSALFFAVHPLRVESVAWITERRDVLSGVFYFGSLLAYLSAAERKDEPRPLRRLALSLALYACALLSKAIGLGFALVLLAVDVYPLRRLPASPRAWLLPEHRPALLEKLPYLLMAFAAGLAGLYGQYQSAAAMPLTEFGPAGRLALAAYGLVFYAWKTLLPTGLLPLYEVPSSFDPLSARYAASAALAAAGGIAVWRLRERFPGLLTAAVVYLAFLAPVLGLVKMGSHLAADRYSYLACAGLAVLAGGWFAKAHSSGGPARALALPVAALAALALGKLTWAQTGHWKNSETLWNYVVPKAPESSLALNNLGDVYFGQGRYFESAAAYRRAIALKPKYAFIHYNLANALAKQKDWSGAEAAYRESLALAPAFSVARANYGNMLADLGRYAEAEAQYLETLRLDPKYADAYYGLADTFLYRDRLKEAREHYEKALAMNPAFSGAAANLALACYKLGDYASSERWYREAIRLKPDLAVTHDNFGNLLLDMGRYAEAVSSYGEALRLDPSRAETYNNIGAAFLRQGLAAEAVPYFERSLQLNPGMEMARKSLATARKMLK